MAFGSIHIRLTRTSSDLRVLSATLLPPSPILKAVDLLTTSTSGEIPILLEANTVARNSPFRESTSSNLGEGPELTISTTGHIKDLLRGDKVRESDKICIVTELPSGRYTESINDTFPTGSAPGKLKSTSHLPCYDVLGGDAGIRSTTDSYLPSMLRKRRYLEGLLLDPQAYCLNTTALSSTTVVLKEDLDGDQLPMIATFHTYSTLPTPTFAHPSASPSADVISPLSSPASRQRHRRPLERARAVRFSGRPKSPRLQPNEVEAHLVHNTPPYPTNHAYSRWQQTDSLITSTSCTTDAVHPFVKHVMLPGELSWLEYMVIELWIDQEGFRAVRPCMQLMGYSPRTRSLHPYDSAECVGPDVTAGVAEFMPMKRETFAFHYATLDSPPTLRKVSVAGESRDHIFRQATLSVKANGVYTVLGTETFTTSMPNYGTHWSRVQNARLRWKFDYLVSDRKVEGTGKTLPGEKTLTPLTFSCSPYLLHPSQGKKVGLIHIMKKNLAPKLGSQKLEPPAHASSWDMLPWTSRHAENGRDVATHTRCHSDAFTKGKQRLQSPLGIGVAAGACQGTTIDSVQRARRRRASSAGEDSLSCSRNESRQRGTLMHNPATLFR